MINCNNIIKQLESCIFTCINPQLAKEAITVIQLLEEQLDRAADTIEELEKKCLNPLERNELEKAMLGRGVDYETIQLILSDFDIRIKHLHSVYQKNLSSHR